MANTTMMLLKAEQHPLPEMLPSNALRALPAVTDPVPLSLPVLPRWVGWANLWIGFLFLPALFAYFVKDGPFAWQGVFVYWFGFGAYGAWLLIMSLTVRRAVLAEAAPPDEDVRGASARAAAR